MADSLLALTQLTEAAQIDNPWSWVVAGYTIVYGAMFGLTGWLWIRLSRIQRQLDDDA
ncbi:MAG: hypothetical protein HKO10_04960 [Acidimicrobiia bacterium]|nr:hypothetical protein [Acidimicrobiia bacterium]